MNVQCTHDVNIADCTGATPYKFQTWNEERELKRRQDAKIRSAQHTVARRSMTVYGTGIGTDSAESESRAFANHSFINSAQDETRRAALDKHAHITTQGHTLA